MPPPPPRVPEREFEPEAASLPSSLSAPNRTAPIRVAAGGESRAGRCLPKRRVVEASAWTNSAKICGRDVFLMPMPVSTTSCEANASRVPPVARISSDATRLGELHRVADGLRRTCRRRVTSPRRLRGNAGIAAATTATSMPLAWSAGRRAARRPLDGAGGRSRGFECELRRPRSSRSRGRR